MSDGEPMLAHIVFFTLKDKSPAAVEKLTASCRELLTGQAGGHQEQAVYGLGPALNQCCGGAVTLLYEVYGPGAVYNWNEMILRSTGEHLTPKYFAEQFIKN